MSTLLLIAISTFVAVNMGVSGFAVSFAPSYGSNVKSRLSASILYSIFVFFGALLIGPRIIETLINKITNPIFIQKPTILIIITSIGISMFISNFFKVPQSTSFVTVSSFFGAALFYQEIYYHTILKIFVVAILFSLISVFASYCLTKIFYPPRNSNLILYEKFFLHQSKMKKFIVFSNCYTALGIGANNVANIVAPITNVFPVNVFIIMIITSFLFGAGGFLMGKDVLNNLSKEIVPIGEPSASIISLVTSSLAITASILGLPTPYAQFTSFSFFGISCLKDGVNCTFKKPIIKRFLCVWIIMPLITMVISYTLHFLFVK